jgi:hypothetical protein
VNESRNSWNRLFPSSGGGVAATAAGVVAHKPLIVASDHPVCGTKVGFAEIFLMPQPPLLARRGIAGANYV